MKHLEEAFTGTWHMPERAREEVGAGAEDTLAALELEHTVPSGGEAEDGAGRGLREISVAAWGKAQPRPNLANRFSLW